jgi:hypothetical protein
VLHPSVFSVEKSDNPHDILMIKYSVSTQTGSNSLTGSLPTELGNLGDLVRLSLGDNELKGRIPESMQYIQNLTELNLCTFKILCQFA